jgi:hypothetical protein
MNITRPEGAPYNLSRRDLLINTVRLATAATALKVLEPITPVAQALEKRVQVAVKIYEVQRFLDGQGNVTSERTRPSEEQGNAYLLMPFQERGRERLHEGQRTVAYIERGQGVGKELIRVEKGNGAYESRLGTDTFVFEGPTDTKAPVECRTLENPCGVEWRDGLKIAAFRMRPNNQFDPEPVFVIDVAEECEPKVRRINDDLREAATVQTPIEATPNPTPTTEVKPAPVQAPAQLPRVQSSPSLVKEFGAVATLPAGQLIRIQYEG